MTAVVIGRESPCQEAIVRLLAEADAYYDTLYPPGSNHLVDVATLDGPDIDFFVARVEGEVAGHGALRVDAEGYGEIKRMYVAARFRGLGVARRLLDRIEAGARARNLDALRLETGIHQPDAIALYERAGYVRREPFGEYRPDPLSLFMEKVLIPEAASWRILSHDMS
jgi:putative acetyltransferase